MVIEKRREYWCQQRMFRRTIVVDWWMSCANDVALFDVRLHYQREGTDDSSDILSWNHNCHLIRFVLNDWTVIDFSLFIHTRTLRSANFRSPPTPGRFPFHRQYCWLKSILLTSHWWLWTSSILEGHRRFPRRRSIRVSIAITWILKSLVNDDLSLSTSDTQPLAPLIAARVGLRGFVIRYDSCTMSVRALSFSSSQFGYQRRQNGKQQSSFISETTRLGAMNCTRCISVVFPLLFLSLSFSLFFCFGETDEPRSSRTALSSTNSRVWSNQE